MKYNLNSQKDRINFDQNAYNEALATFQAAPDAWLTFDEGLAADVVAQNRYVREEQDLVNDHDEADARDLAQMRQAWSDWQESSL